MPKSHNQSICLVCPRFAPGRDVIDSERHFFNLIAVCARVYAEVCVLAQAEYPDLPSAYMNQYQTGLTENVRVQILPEPLPLKDGNSLKAVLRTPVYIMNWLAGQQFDRIIFSDYGGFGYYCMLAKYSGLQFADTELSVVVDAPLIFRLRAWKEPVYSINQLAQSHIELESIAQADSIAVTSRAVWDWVVETGIKLEQKPNLMSGPMLPALPRQPEAPGAPPDELIFYGEADIQHGIHLFCNAVSRLSPEVLDGKKISIICARKPRLTIRRFIGNAAKKWPRQPRLEFSIGRRQQLAYIASSNAIIVAMDMSGRPGINAYECLQMTRPIVTIPSPEILALYEGASVDSYVSPATPAALARKMTSLLQAPHGVETLACGIPSREQDWLDFLTTRPKTRSTGASHPASPRPLVSICVMHHERPHLLRQSIESCTAQSYENIEIIVLDDGSTNPATLAELSRIESDYQSSGLKLVRQENKYLGAARNTAVKHASGDYVFFLDDDNLLFAEAIEQLVAVAIRRNLDILGSFSRVFSGAQRPSEKDRRNGEIFHIGGAIDFGIFRNGFLDSNTLIKTAFFRAIDGNTEDYGAGRDDQEFFARAALHNAKMSILPAPLYWARQLPQRLRHLHVNRFAGSWRVADAYLGQLDPRFRGIALFAQGSGETSQHPEISQARTLELLDSVYWRITRPFRMLTEAIEQELGLPVGVEKLYEDDTNLENPPPEIAISILSSYSWQISAPIRFTIGVARVLYAKTVKKSFRKLMSLLPRS